MRAIRLMNEGNTTGGLRKIWLGRSTRPDFFCDPVNIDLICYRTRENPLKLEGFKKWDGDTAIPGQFFLSLPVVSFSRFALISQSVCSHYDMIALNCFGRVFPPALEMILLACFENRPFIIALLSFSTQFAVE